MKSLGQQKDSAVTSASLSKDRLITGTLAMLWLGVIGVCLFMLSAYANSPGSKGRSQSNWPEATAIARDPKLPTFVMFIHPHCPCSRASIGELALLMARCQGRVNAHVMFLAPASEDPDWTLTDTWRQAEMIPGVQVARDEAGREAKLFGAETSGDSVLYDSAGRLKFRGGITISRGHSGDNPGRASLETLLLSGGDGETNTPVFGCPLFKCPDVAAK